MNKYWFYTCLSLGGVIGSHKKRHQKSKEIKHRAQGWHGVVPRRVKFSNMVELVANKANLHEGQEIAEKCIFEVKPMYIGGNIKMGKDSQS